MEVNMKLRYVELSPDIIFNWLDPFNITAKWACKAITGDWWSERNILIRKEFGTTWMLEFDKITGHFTDLEESIKAKGILTPICVDSGPPRGKYLKPHHFTPMMQKDLSHALVTQIFGGSRLTIANKLRIEKVPCIVYDYVNMFPDEPEVNKNNYSEWFGDEYFWTSQSPNIKIKHSSHIKNKKYDGMNGSTRKAQRHAAVIAREKTYKKFGLKGDK